MQLQFSLRQVFSICSYTCPISLGLLLNIHLQLSTFWELFILRSCSFFWGGEGNLPAGAYLVQTRW